MTRLRLTVLVLSVATLGVSARGQDLSDLRQALRESLKDSGYARSLTSMVLLSEELQFSGAVYRVDQDDSVRLSTLVFPFHTTFRPWDDDAPGLYLEAALGTTRATQDVGDLWGGQLPGLETGLEAAWSTHGGMVGLGLEFAPAEDLTVTPILGAGLARVENDTRFRGPGADFTAALTDGILTNWSAEFLTTGVGTRIDWTGNLGERHHLSLVGRYDLHWTRTIREDDPAQDFSTRSHLVTLGGDVLGPTGLTCLGGPLDWRAKVTYRRFLEGDVLEVDELLQVGGSLELRAGEQLPLVGGLTLEAGVILGEDLTGWVLGLGVKF